MKINVGLWIDHREAVIVTLTNGEEKVKRIMSNMEKHVRFANGSSQDGENGSTQEDVRDRQFGNHLDSFYDEVISSLRDGESIQIFGPGEAKVELGNRLEHEGLAGRVIGLQTVDKMTDRQITAKVRQLFS